jgi:hypothetical protein
MSDRQDDTPTRDAEPRDADQLADAVSDLGETDDDRLDAVQEHNESLEERLPSPDELPRTHGTPSQG